MAREVRAEAVFDTTKAVVSLNAYTVAINNAIAAHNALTAAIVTNVAAAQGQLQTVRAAAAAYNALSAAAQRAATNIRSANTAPPPRRQAGGPGGGQGGDGSGRSSSFFGLSGNQYFGLLIASAAVKSMTDSMFELVDSWTRINGQAALLTGSLEGAEIVQKSMFSLAQKAGQDYEDVANSFNKIFAAGKDVGMTVTQAKALTDAIVHAGMASNRTTQEIRSFGIQFPQALARGKLSGDELTSIMENFPFLIDTIARNWQKVNGEIGLTRGEFLTLARSQKAYANEVANAIFRGRDELAEFAARAPQTIEQSIVRIKNIWLKTVGEMAENLGFKDRIIIAFKAIEDSITSLAGMNLIVTILKAVATTVELISAAISSGELQRGFNDFIRFMSDLYDIAKKLVGLVRYVLEDNSGNSGFFGGIFKSLIQGPYAASQTEQARRRTQEIEDQIKAERELEERLRRLDEERTARRTATGAIQSERAAFYQGPEIVPPMTQNWAEEDKALENRRKAMEERIALLKEEIALEHARKKGGQEAVIIAKANLDIERAITADDKEKFPQLVAQTEELIRQKSILEQQREIENRERPVRERIAQLREEISLKEVERTGDERLIEAAKERLRIEKLVTEQLRQNAPALAAEIEMLEKRFTAAERAAKQVEQWAELYGRMGKVLVDSMIKAGEEGRSFASGLRDAGKQFADMLMRALLFDPVIKAISLSMGKLTESLTGQGPGMLGDFLTRLLGALGGAFGGGAGGGAPMGHLVTASMGRAFMGGHLTAYAQGGVVSGPTLFGHRGGLGLMGEAGDEAILPLFRGPGGALGVRSGGSGSVVNNISVKVDGDMTEATRARMMDDFERFLNARTPGIVKQSTRAVQSEHPANPNYLRR